MGRRTSEKPTGTLMKGVFQGKTSNNGKERTIDPPQHGYISSKDHMLTSRIYHDLRHNLETKNIKRVLEIGTFNGYGISLLANLFNNVEFFVVDPFIEDGCTGYIKGEKLISQRHNAYSNFDKLKNLTLFEMTSQEFHESYINTIKDKEIDYIIIDGSHNYDDVKVDFEICKQVLSINGIVDVDDFHIPDVKQAYDDFMEQNSDCFTKLNNGFIRIA
jgi:hypothetical protein